MNSFHSSAFHAARPKACPLCCSWRMIISFHTPVCTLLFHLVSCSKSLSYSPTKGVGYHILLSRNVLDREIIVAHIPDEPTGLSS